MKAPKKSRGGKMIQNCIGIMRIHRSFCQLCGAAPLIASLLLWGSSATAQSGGWSDDFGSYTLGSFPSAWVNSGNNGGSVVNTYAAPGSTQSLQMYGQVGGCWATLAHRQLQVTPPFTVQVSIRNGNEATSGCHPDRGFVGLNTGPSWTTAGVALLDSAQSGALYAGSSLSGGQFLENASLLQWNTIRMGYEFVNSSTVQVTYWIDGQPGITITRPAVAQEASMAWLTLAAEEGTAWFDNVQVIPGVAPPSAPSSILPQFVFGGGWYTALYFTNLNASPVSFAVNFTGSDGNPSTVSSLGGSSSNVSLSARGTARLEALNTGPLTEGYASVALPAGVAGYAVFRQSVAGVPDQEAVVPFSSSTATTNTLAFDETNYITGVAVVNLAPIASTISVTA
jgi:hypothetical protein